VLANEKCGGDITVNVAAPGSVAIELFLTGKTEAQSNNCASNFHWEASANRRISPMWCPLLPTMRNGFWCLALNVVFTTISVSGLLATFRLIVRSRETANWTHFIVVFPLTFASSAFVHTDALTSELRVLRKTNIYQM
jgi:hypothetical protein